MSSVLSRRSLIAATAALLPLRLSAATDRWAATRTAAGGLDQLRALVISQDGEVVLAEAFRGPAVDRAVNVKSVSKTIVAAVTGAAIDRGVVPAITATLAETAPDLIPEGADPRVGRLTLENLVTMQAGLERTSGSGYGGWVSSRNWVANALSRPFVAEPGGQMLYSTGSFHVLGAALAEASGDSLLAMTRDWIGDPLGIEIPAWTRDPQGFYLGGNEMALSPLAMVRFGEMVRTGGLSGETRVLSEGWVAASLEPRTRSAFSGLDYGYGWFLGEAGGQRIALARGYGGQIIAILPDLRLTVAITSDPTLPARSEGYFGTLMSLMGTEIVSDALA